MAELNKIYAVVVFRESGEEVVNIVPASWVDEMEGTCSWPSASKNLATLISNCRGASPDWKKFPVAIVRNGIEGMKKAKIIEKNFLAEKNGQLSVDSPLPLKRTKVQKVCYTPDGSEDDASVSSDEESPDTQKKRKKVSTKRIVRNLNCTTEEETEAEIASSPEKYPTPPCKEKERSIVKNMIPRTLKIFENTDSSEKVSTVPRKEKGRKDSRIDKSSIDKFDRIIAMHKATLEASKMSDAEISTNDARSPGMEEVKKSNKHPTPTTPLSEVEVSPNNATPGMEGKGNSTKDVNSSGFTSSMTASNASANNFKEEWSKMTKEDREYFLAENMYLMRKEIKTLNKNQGLPSALPADFLKTDKDLAIFPILNPDDMEKVTEDIKSKDGFKKKLILAMLKKKCAKLEDSARTMGKFIMTDEVGKHYSLYGAKKKNAFLMTHLGSLYFKTLQASFPNATEQQIRDAINLWLSHCSDRLKKKANAVQRKEKILDIDLFD